jgi:DMSO/TMAO reductase YedYZ molybdopterin-dependent catalytic subunit
MSLSLIPITNRPLNAETPLAALDEAITPTELFYVRNHFDIPALVDERFRLHIAGRTTLALSLDEIKALPAKTLCSTMECAGNGRIFMEPKPAGTPWELGAVSVAEWTGTPLVGVLEQAGIGADIVEVLFVGADAGVVEGKATHYERSLPLAIATHPDTLLVWAMNGEPLAPAHGYPLRLFVPGWYGMASVKWLAQIRLLAQPFEGYYQTHHYVYWNDDYAPDGQPLQKMQVRALICSPQEGDVLDGAELMVRGVAWSGQGEVIHVQVSTREGQWANATVEPALAPYTTQRWHFCWRPPGPGEYTLQVRATDAAGHAQPLHHRSNRLGYGNNAVHTLAVTVLPAKL